MTAVGATPLSTAALRIGLLIALGILVLDQFTKWLIFGVVFGLPLSEISWGNWPWQPGIEITGFFNLVTVWNRGVSFGMFSSDSQLISWILTAFALAICVVLVVWLRRARGILLIGAIGSVIGGAIGNVVDRVRFGAVADFLDFHAFGYHWPAFNVADAAISVGVALMLIDSLFASGRSNK